MQIPFQDAFVIKPKKSRGQRIDLYSLGLLRLHKKRFKRFYHIFGHVSANSDGHKRSNSRKLTG